MSNLSSSIQNSIKLEVERMRCPVHEEHPKLSFTPSGFSVSCCCDAFRQKVIRKCNDAIKNVMKQEIEKTLRGFR